MISSPSALHRRLSFGVWQVASKPVASADRCHISRALRPSGPRKSISCCRSPAVNIVAHEQVIGVGTVAADAAQLQQVLELPVDVAADGDWAPDWLHIALLNLRGQGHMFVCKHQMRRHSDMVPTIQLFTMYHYAAQHCTVDQQC